MDNINLSVNFRDAWREFSPIISFKMSLLTFKDLPNRRFLNVSKSSDRNILNQFWQVRTYTTFKCHTNSFGWVAAFKTFFNTKSPDNLYIPIYIVHSLMNG